KKHPRGEIGILRRVVPSKISPAEKCFLYIEHEGSEYMGCLLFDDRVFCSQIAELLQGCCNHPIAENWQLRPHPYSLGANRDEKEKPGYPQAVERASRLQGKDRPDMGLPSSRRAVTA